MTPNKVKERGVKKKIEELEKRIQALENQRIIYVQPYPQWIQPASNACTCNTVITSPCPIHGYPNRYIVTC